MEKTKEEQRTRSTPAGVYRDKKAVIHRRTMENPPPFVPKIRVVGDINVRELLGRDPETDDEPNDVKND